MTDPTSVYDAIIVGGGPAGATVAEELARAGRHVLLLDKAGRIKPCGGAIPPRLIRDFAIPDDLIVARINSARIVAPSDRHVDMPIDGGYVGMVDRDVFDEFLRARAERAGAERRTGAFERLDRDDRGIGVISYRPPGAREGELSHAKGRIIVGADGARSEVARQGVPEAGDSPSVFAYHEIVRVPSGAAAGPGAYDPRRCDVYYQGGVSPDFYGWVFPHGPVASVGVGSAEKGFSLRRAAGRLREAAGLGQCETVRREGAPIPLRPLRRWDNGRDVVLVGDACGVVAPASGEGIYYAMASARLTAAAVDEALAHGDGRVLCRARAAFMKAHGRVFWVLGLLQHFWYRNDKRRERFVSMCADPDVQQLTWQAYMNKELVKARPGAHMRIFWRDMGHLLGVGSP
jgi:geranylgeranyl reductase